MGQSDSEYDREHVEDSETVGEPDLRDRRARLPTPFDEDGQPSADATADSFADQLVEPVQETSVVSHGLKKEETSQETGTEVDARPMKPQSYDLAKPVWIRITARVTDAQIDSVQEDPSNQGVSGRHNP